VSPLKLQQQQQQHYQQQQRYAQDSYSLHDGAQYSSSSGGSGSGSGSGALDVPRRPSELQA
jgi:hypothetical protein